MEHHEESIMMEWAEHDTVVTIFRLLINMHFYLLALGAIYKDPEKSWKLKMKASTIWIKYESYQSNKVN